MEVACVKERVSVFGALSKDKFVSMTLKEKCNAQTYLRFLNLLLNEENKVLIAVDGAKYHFEKEFVQKFYNENKHRLKVTQLPGYSPELNPIEQEWKNLKHWMSISIWGTQEEFELKLKEGLENSELRPKMFDYFVP